MDWIAIILSSHQEQGGSRWGGRGARAPPIIWDFAPIHYLLNSKIPIYCLALQCQLPDYLLDPF